MNFNKEKIKGSKLNPKNWGVPDYSSKKDFGMAYSTARKEGKKEFLFNGKRYNTNYKGTPQQQLKETGILDNRLGVQGKLENRAYNTVKPSVYDDNAIGQNIKNFVNNRDRFDTSESSDLVKQLKEANKNKDYTKVKKILKKLKSYNSNYSGLDDPYSEDAWRIYLGKPQSENTFNVSNYRPSKSKDVNMNYYSLPEAFKEELFNLYNSKEIKEGVNSEFSFENVFGENSSRARVLGNFTVNKGKDERGEYISYYDKYDLSPTLPVVGKSEVSNYLGKPFEIYDRIYIKDYGDGKQKRMYYTDKELLELDINKKNFDTLALQRELSNRGYKLPKSTKKDGDFDGIWGDETKNALLDYQAKNTAHKIKQDEFIKHYNGGKLNNHTNINMKYNKEKTKKFASGGKTPKEIMEEARRNQAIERQAQARDAVRTSGIAAYQSTPVTIQAPRQELVLKEFEPSTFSQAFRAARKAGLKEFTWRGKRYTTELAGTAANTPVVNSPTNNVPLSEEQLRRNAIIREYGTEGFEVDNTAYDKEAPSTSVVYTPTPTPTSTPNKSGISPGALQSTTTQSRNPNFMERGLFGWVWDNLRRIDQENRAAQIENKRIWNEKYAKHQQGGQLHLRNIWEKIFGITPDYTPVNSQESITSYMDNTLKGPVEKRVIRKKVPYANLYSIMSIRNPGTNKADTTFITPSGTKYKMDDVRSGKAPSGYSYKFFKKPVGYFQQGGTIENEESSSMDQLYVDFAIRYLKAKGISEDNMVDDEGGLKDEFLEEVSNAINEVDSPDFWEQYQSNPDAAVQSYIESKMEPEQIEMARKGAKLKKLKKLKKGGIKSRKCKCGCDLIMKKEAGGTIVEVCACGCKNK